MDYKQKMMIAMAETLKAYTSGTQPWIVTYSGGKDSTVTLDIVIRSMLQLKKHNPAMLKRDVYLLTAQTHMDFVTDPLKQEELIKIKSVIQQNELPIEIREVSAPIEKSFIYLVVGKGYPLPKSRMNRWCTERLKIEPTQKETKSLNPDITLLGVRLSESVERRNSIENHQTSEFHSETAFMPIINFTLEDVWSYLVREGTSWGNADKLGQLYKDATGECGLRQKKAGAGEKTDDPCGARTGCIICPVVTIDKSSQEFAKSHPWLQPYVDLRNIIRRDGCGVKARMKLYTIVKQAEADNEELCRRYGAEPQKLIYSDELDKLIQQQWESDLIECPWVEDAMEVGLYYETKLKGLDGFQLIINFHHESFNGVV